MFEEMTEKEQKTIKRVALVCGVVLAAVLFRVTAVTKIPANTVGVYYSATSGVQNKTLSSGYHIKVPFMDTIYKLSTSVQTSNIEKVTTQTNDAQFLDSTIDVKWRVSNNNAMQVFKDFQTIETLQEKGIQPAVQRAIEEVTVNYNIVEILGSKRNEIYSEFEKKLAEKLSTYGVELVSVTITDTDAGDEIEAAIKNEAVKQKEVDTAKQEQEKTKVEAETKKIQAQADADAEVIKAQGQADANAKLSGSITDELIRMKEAEARLKHGWVEVQTTGDVITNKGD
ncbi:prohibitin family protein [Streptococcus suis]|uniref:prohibitin family protein n=1 Tax=Streptococcus suis TaxID=1307 RepID=UPI0014790E12|nr:prohibitin family protein [Streptococcus suis]